MLKILIIIKKIYKLQIVKTPYKYTATIQHYDLIVCSKFPIFVALVKRTIGKTCIFNIIIIIQLICNPNGRTINGYETNLKKIHWLAAQSAHR